MLYDWGLKKILNKQYLSKYKNCSKEKVYNELQEYIKSCPDLVIKENPYNGYLFVTYRSDIQKDIQKETSQII